MHGIKSDLRSISELSFWIESEDCAENKTDFFSDLHAQTSWVRRMIYEKLRS